MLERNAKFLIGLVLFVLAVLTVGVYTYRQSREYISGPQVIIKQPATGAVLSQNPILISGNAQNVAYITLNGAPIFVDSKGNFNEKLLLEPGYNIFTINARDRFGKKTEKILQLIYKEATSSPL